MTGDDFAGEKTPAFEPRGLFDLDADAPVDELRRDGPRSGAARWVSLSVAVVLVLSAVGVSLYRSAQRQHQRVAYDKLIALSAAGEQAVASAVSRTRDVVQYAEPLLNASQTTPATRTTLLKQVADAAEQSRAGIEAQRAKLASASAPGKLRLARDATEKYLTDWAAVFSNAAGNGEPLQRVENDLLQEQNAARDALRAAAPDKDRAAQADGVLGSLGW